MDDDACVLIWVSSTLCCDRVLLVTHRFSHVDVAVLKNGDGVAEDEVYGSVYVTFTVELALGVYV